MKHKKQYYELLVRNVEWNTSRNLTKSSLNWDLETDMLMSELKELVDADTEVDKLDALEDLKFLINGAQSKMGLSPEQIVECTEAVVTANEQKPTSTDLSGKIIKPVDFVGPEPKLQEILNNRI